jgi:hypothetical protein
MKVYQKNMMNLNMHFILLFVSRIMTRRGSLHVT